MALLEIEVMRFADSYASLEAEAADDFIAKAATPEARIAGVKWKLGQATAAYIDATGPNAALNALDLVVLATASRMVVESYGMEVFGEAGRCRCWKPSAAWKPTPGTWWTGVLKSGPAKGTDGHDRGLAPAEP